MIGISFYRPFLLALSLFFLIFNQPVLADEPGATKKTENQEPGFHCEFRCRPENDSASSVSTLRRGGACQGRSDTMRCVGECNTTCGVQSGASRCVQAPGPACVEDTRQESESQQATRKAVDADIGQVMDPLQGVTIPTMIGVLVKILFGIAGALFLAFFIVGGFQWMLARGESKGVEQAQKTIVNAVIGIVVVLISYTLVNALLTIALTLRGGS